MNKQTLKQLIAAQTAEIKELRYQMVAYQRYLIQIDRKVELLAGDLNGMNNQTIRVTVPPNPEKEHSNKRGGPL